MNQSDRLPEADIRVWNTFLGVHKAILDRFNRVYAEVGAIGLVEHEVLGRLARASEGKLRIQDLADLLLVSKSGASRIIDRMEKMGLVQREKSSIDRRVVYTRLTQAGEDMVHVSRQALRRAYEQNFKEVLSDEELATLVTLMKRLTSGEKRGEQVAVGAAASR